MRSPSIRIRQSPSTPTLHGGHRTDSSREPRVQSRKHTTAISGLQRGMICSNLMVFVSSNGLLQPAVNFRLPGSTRCWEPATEAYGLAPIPVSHTLAIVNCRVRRTHRAGLPTSSKEEMEKPGFPAYSTSSRPDQCVESPATERSALDNLRAFHSLQPVCWPKIVPETCGSAIRVGQCGGTESGRTALLLQPSGETTLTDYRASSQLPTVPSGWDSQSEGLEQDSRE